jgi:type-F conjugative transfer system protein TrbI
MIKLKRTSYFKAAISIILALMIVQFTYFYQNRHPPIVTFDLTATLEQYQAALKESNIAPSEQVKCLSIFSDAISRATQIYSEEHNVIIVESSAVIAGAIDDTQEIQKAIIIEFQANSMMTFQTGQCQSE